MVLHIISSMFGDGLTYAFLRRMAKKLAVSNPIKRTRATQRYPCTSPGLMMKKLMRVAGSASANKITHSLEVRLDVGLHHLQFTKAFAKVTKPTIKNVHRDSPGYSSGSPEGRIKDKSMQPNDAATMNQKKTVALVGRVSTADC